MKPQISIDEFNGLDLRVGEVQAVSEVPGSDTLVGMVVNFGHEIGIRAIYAGLRKWYPMANLAGRKLAFVVNLAPKKFVVNGSEYISEGMILAADNGEKAVLYTFDQDLPAGCVLR
jgi:methionyl-tRNA synthetase